MSLTNNDLLRAAKDLNCEVAAIRAVDAVESGGKGFQKSGEITVRFETRLFFAKTGYTVTGSDGNAFIKAKHLNRQAAIECTSWGRYQILGSNYKLCGFASAEDYLAAQLLGEPQQLQSFVRFILNSKLDDELRNHQWRAFSLVYNGPKSPPKYAADMATAYDKFSKEPFPANEDAISTKTDYGTAIFALVLLVFVGGAAYLYWAGYWPILAAKIKRTFHFNSLKRKLHGT